MRTICSLRRPFRHKFHESRMQLVTIVPEERPAVWADGHAFLRVALAVFINVGAIDDRWAANSREIDYSHVGKMLLHNPFFTKFSLEFAAQNASHNQMMFVFRQ